jgi:transcriptional regulator with XRE-family HTH domain
MSKKGPHPVDKQVGANVRTARLLKNMSQEKLGDELNLTFQQVQKYEKGTNRISASKLSELSNILDQPIGYFFNGVKTAQGVNNEIMALTSSAEATHILKTYAKAGETGRSFMDLLAGLVEKKGL